MKHASIFLLITLLMSSVPIIAQKVRQKSMVPKTAATLLSDKKLKSKCSFSNQELDLMTESLPENYIGNNIQALTFAVIRNSNVVKDEFETTIQFHDRLENEKKRKLVGDLTYSSTFAFSDNSDFPFLYDADAETLTIRFSLGSQSFLRTSCFPNLIANINSFFLKKGTLSFSHSLEKVMQLKPEDARLLKPNLRTLYIGTLSNIGGSFSLGSKTWIKTVENDQRITIAAMRDRDTSEVIFNAAKRNAERNRELLEAKVISKLAYEDALDELKKAEAEFENKDRLLKLSEKELYIFIDPLLIPYERETPILNVQLKELWIYNISTGKVLIKHKIEN